MADRSTAVVPAAGASRRMGRPKLLLPYRGRTVLEAVLASLHEGGATSVVVVVRPEETALRRLVDDSAPYARVVANPDPERGMLSTILAGLNALTPEEREEPVAFCPADLPALRPSTVRAVASPVVRGEARLAVPVAGGRRGHPLVVAPPLLAEIPRLRGDRGLKELVERHAADLLEVPVDDPGAVHDVDTPADYAELVKG